MRHSQAALAGVLVLFFIFFFLKRPHAAVREWMRWFPHVSAICSDWDSDIQTPLDVSGTYQCDIWARASTLLVPLLQGIALSRSLRGATLNGSTHKRCCTVDCFLCFLFKHTVHCGDGVALTLLCGACFPYVLLLVCLFCRHTLQHHLKGIQLSLTHTKKTHINQSSVWVTDIASVSHDINGKRLTSSLSVIYQTNERQIIKPVILKATCGSVTPISWAGEAFAASSHEMRR